MPRKLATALVLAGFALVVALLLVQGRREARARPAEPIPPAWEVRGRGGEEGPREPDAEAEPEPASAAIRGTVTKEDGPAWCVRISAVAGGKVVADTGTDPNGRYRVEVPPDCDVVLEIRPDPATGLLPFDRAFRLAAGEEIVADVRLEAPPSASGRVEGLGPDETVILLAIRAEDFPALPPDPLLAAGALEAAPKLVTASRGGFRFRQLDPAATYRLAAAGMVWAVRDAVYFRAGDDAILARLDLVLPVSLDVTDLETGAPVPRFTLQLVDLRGEVRDTLDGRMGKASRSPLPANPAPATEPAGYWRWRSEVTNLLNRWRFVVSAEGYHEQGARGHETAVALQRIREPNVLLRVEHPDGTPYDGELTGRFGPGFKAVLHVRREAPGRFLAELPPGEWRVGVARPGVVFDAEPAFDLAVPREGTVEAEPVVFERTGTVTFESDADFTLQRAVGGQWNFRSVGGGKYELPAGDYRVLVRDQVVTTFHLAAGGRESVKVARPR